MKWCYELCSIQMAHHVTNLYVSNVYMYNEDVAVEWTIEQKVPYTFMLCYYLLLLPLLHGILCTMIANYIFSVSVEHHVYVFFCFFMSIWARIKYLFVLMDFFKNCIMQIIVSNGFIWLYSDFYMVTCMFCCVCTHSPPQVFICHDQITGRDLAVKVLICDHSISTTESLYMQQVSNMCAY